MDGWRGRGRGRGLVGGVRSNVEGGDGRWERVKGGFLHAWLASGSMGGSDGVGFSKGIGHLRSRGQLLGD